MRKATSGRLKFPPLVFFPSRDVAFALAPDSRAVPAAQGTAPLPAASGIPSLLLSQAGMRAAPWLAPTGYTKSFCDKGKVGINPFLNSRARTPRKCVT